MTTYTLDIIRRQHVVPGTLTAVELEGLACEHVGGIFGYLTSESIDAVLVVLNMIDQEGERITKLAADTPNWFQTPIAPEQDTDFAANAEEGELDVLCKDGEAIGYVIRDNPATIYLITVLNGKHIMNYPKFQEHLAEVAG